MELRVLATTDIHLQLLGFDYVQDRAIPHAGLAGLSTLIRSARTQAAARGMGCILLDNGDFLQGSPMGCTLARQPVTKTHPIVASLNHLKYSALGIGNHDLDYGLSYLTKIAGVSDVPFISSNLELKDASPLLKTAILTCADPNPEQGKPNHIRIGVIAVLPEQTAILNKRQLSNRGTIMPGLQSVQDGLNTLRSENVDIVILLAHLGMEGPEKTAEYLDDVREYAVISEIDAIIAGHTHRRLPGSDHQDYAAVDAEGGSIHQCPTLMPGFDASDLAVLDLQLDWQESSGWKITNHSASLRSNTADVPADPEIVALCAPAHHAVRAKLARPCGHIDQTMHNYFSLAMPTATGALVACAKYAVVAQGLINRPEQDLPILATSPAHTAGGRAGPGHYLNIPAGPIYQRHLEGLNPHSDEICGLLLTGRDLHQWLEHSARVFNQLDPKTPVRPLRKPDQPAFNFDTIYGLDYAMDLTRPPGQRITRKHHAGVPVRADQRFVLATSTFRATGGGGRKSFEDRMILTCGDASLVPALANVMCTNHPVFSPSDLPWRFSVPSAVQTIIKTSPEALAFLSDISHLDPEYQGKDAAGFARIRLTL